MNREKQKKMIAEFVKNNGVTKLTPDTRGTTFLDREFELRRKKMQAKFKTERSARNRRLKLLDKG
jgi:hypothetical protein|tara:strand:+ start:989 stop:1183 length:195 start_codon:yes stop_codon:yes gene_type:complete